MLYRLGMDKWCHHTLNWACDYLSILRLELDSVKNVTLDGIPLKAFPDMHAMISFYLSEMILVATIINYMETWHLATYEAFDIEHASRHWPLFNKQRRLGAAKHRFKILRSSCNLAGVTTAVFILINRAASSLWRFYNRTSYCLMNNE